MSGIFDTDIFDVGIFDTPRLQNEADEYATIIVSGVLSNDLTAGPWSNQLTGKYRNEAGAIFDTGIFDTGIFAHIEVRDPFPTLNAIYPREQVLRVELSYERNSN